MRLGRQYSSDRNPMYRGEIGYRFLCTYDALQKHLTSNLWAEQLHREVSNEMDGRIGGL